MEMVTYVICTHNRADVLPNAVNSFVNFINDGSELVIVDSASNQDTIDYLNQVVTSHSNIRVVRVDELGIAKARNAGVLNVENGYVAFIDDDAKFTEGYARKLKEIINGYSPDIIGGPIYPYYLCDKPSWFKDQYEVRMHNQETGFVNHPKFSASNLVIRRGLFDKVGMFDVNFGTLGRNVFYGEETDFLLRSKEFQCTYYYDLNLIVEHLVPHYKMDVMFALLAQYRSGQSAFKMGQSSGILKSADFSFMLNQFFGELNNVLVEDHNNSEQLIWERLSHDFKTIGYLSERMHSENGEGTINAEDSFNQKVRQSKPISFKEYLLTMAVVTKKFLKSKI